MKDWTIESGDYNRKIESPKKNYAMIKRKEKITKKIFSAIFFLISFISIYLVLGFIAGN